MQLHEIKTIHKSKKTKRIGRGGHRGTFSGRGCKGQNARAGRKKMPMIREIIKRYPKLRGYRGGAIRDNFISINLDILENKFEAGEIVNPENLLEKGIIRRINGKTPQIKILGKGEIKKSLTIENCKTSKEAKAKIEKVGGTVKNPKSEILNPKQIQNSKFKNLNIHIV